MRFSCFVFCVFSLWPYLSLALLEEKFVDFVAGNGTLDIAGASIIADANDFAGVHIAIKSLGDDLEKITGVRPEIRNVTGNSTSGGNSTRPATDRAIIVGSLNSTLIRQLSGNGVIGIADIEGKWEMFKTAVVANPLPGVNKALVITGSDKRGTIFGVHTLAEHSGQSP